MKTSAASSRTVAFVATLSAMLGSSRFAGAEVRCAIPELHDDVCHDATATIDGYKDCYRDFYDENVIPAFKATAQCSVLRTDSGLREVLEKTAHKITDVIDRALTEIQLSLSAPTGVLQTCMGDLNAVDAALSDVLAKERDAVAHGGAPALEALRRTYSFASFTDFTNKLLLARQVRGACDTPLQNIRRSLVLLNELKVHHLDYCQILRNSATYSSLAKIDPLAKRTAIDPEIHFDQYFNVLITWNTQCGYYDFSVPGASTIQASSCPTLTAEYQQTLSGMDGTLGWLASNRDEIVLGSTLAASTIFSLAGYGTTAAGPYGTLVSLGVGLVIVGLEYLSLRNSEHELNQLIADKERELKEVVADNLITEAQFHDKLETACAGWQGVVDDRVDAILGKVHSDQHISEINAFYVLSDSLNDWYNELFLWASEPDANGHRFLDEVARQELLAQKNAFDQRIFGARADQEVASQKNTMTNIKGAVTVVSCANLTPLKKRVVKAQLTAGVNTFNRKCASTMDAIAVQPSENIALANTAESHVACVYRGFRSDVASLEVANGDGFASNLVLRNDTGTIIATIPNVSSDAASGGTTLPGFGCAADDGSAFGTNEANRLATGTYPLQMKDNIFGFDKSDAASMRSSLQSLDSQLRLKEIVCTRQLGTPLDIPRTADTCGIPPPL